MTGIFSTALMCIALNVYKEARGEPFIAKTAVAHVTLNRVKARRKDACNVVFETKQFSWTIKDVRHGSLKASAYPDFKSKAWTESLLATNAALRGRDHTRGATHYHEVRIQPYWVPAFKFVGRWGNHLFYREA